MPRAKEKAKRTGGEVLKVVLGVLGGIAATVIAAVSGELVKTDQFWETVGFRSEKITVKRAIVYGRIEYFSDRRLNDAKPFQIKEVGLPDTNVRTRMPLFDEALYMRAYYLSPHKVEKMELESHSSGLTDVTPVIPHAAEFVHEAYEKSKGRNLQFFVNIKDADYVIVAHHYYNGFQYNPDSRKYESDGGVHILHPTGELIVIFDLSALDYRRLLKSDPKLFIRNKAGETPQLLKGSYENGVLTSQTIKNPPVGAHIFWDWEWSSEAQS